MGSTFGSAVSWLDKKKELDTDLPALRERSLADQPQLNSINGGRNPGSLLSTSVHNSPFYNSHLSSPSSSSSSLIRSDRYNKGRCTLNKLPLEIREMIYEFSMDCEWTGKIPELIKALRADKISGGMLYDEALGFFYQGNGFVLHLENDWGFNGMDWCVIKDIKKIIVVPMNGMINSQSWRFEDCLGDNLGFFLPKCNIEEITLNFSLVTKNPPKSPFGFETAGNGAIHNPLFGADKYWFWGLIAAFEHLKKITLVLPSPGVSNGDGGVISSTIMTPRFWNRGFNPGNRWFRKLGLEITKTSLACPFEEDTEEQGVTELTKEDLERYGGSEVWVWELNANHITSRLPKSLGSIYKFVFPDLDLLGED